MFKIRKYYLGKILLKWLVPSCPKHHEIIEIKNDINFIITLFSCCLSQVYRKAVVGVRGKFNLNASSMPICFKIKFNEV